MHVYMHAPAHTHVQISQTFGVGFVLFFLANFHFFVLVCFHFCLLFVFVFLFLFNFGGFCFGALFWFFVFWGVLFVFWCFCFCFVFCEKEEGHEVGWVEPLGGSGKSFVSSTYRELVCLEQHLKFEFPY